jgi:hypothetical protein
MIGAAKLLGVDLVHIFGAGRDYANKPPSATTLAADRGAIANACVGWTDLSAASSST